jgi:hypothetical protein
LKSNLRGDRISDEKSQKKRWSIAYSRKNKALIDKMALTEVLYTNYTINIKIQVYLKIEPQRR